MKLQQRVALVTGAARGIGRAIAARFVAEGATVVMADVNDEAGRAAATALGADYLHCDVSRTADVEAALAAIVARHGALDILVNNAAISVVKDFLDLTDDDFDRVIAINLRGVFLLAQRSARQMIAQAEAGRKAGCIINMSSINDTVAIPTIVPYCASKGGVTQLTRAISIALAHHGIRVNGIGPGSIATEMFNATVNTPEAVARVMSRTPLGRPGEPDEVAAVAAFLACDDSSYMTGQTVYVDGGRLPLNYTVPVRR